MSSILVDETSIEVWETDTHPIYFELYDPVTGLPADLTGATYSVWITKPGSPEIQLQVTPALPLSDGRLVHVLTGTLAPGSWQGVVKVKKNGQQLTTPISLAFCLTVIATVGEALA